MIDYHGYVYKILETSELANSYKNRKRSALPARYSRENRDEKVASVKTKIIKLESIDRDKESAIQNLVSNVEIFELSYSDIEDDQGLIERVPNGENDRNQHHNSASAILAGASDVNNQKPTVHSAVVAFGCGVNNQRPNDSPAVVAGGSGASMQRPNVSLSIVTGGCGVKQSAKYSIADAVASNVYHPRLNEYLANGDCVSDKENQRPTGQSNSSQRVPNPLSTDELAGSAHKFHQDVSNDYLYNLIS